MVKQKSGMQLLVVNMFATITGAVRAYRYRKRLPPAVVWLGFMAAWAYVERIKLPVGSGIVVTALFFGFLCERKSWPFWLFFGIGLGAMLVVLLSGFAR